MSEREIKVWDLPVRLFHWALVALVATGAATGYYAPEWWMGWHAAAGYGLALLLAFRVIWGVFGSEYARIASFAHGPRAVIEHLRGLMLLRPPHYLGHNPTGAVMIFALIAVVFALVVTGLLVLGGEEHQGPLAALVSFETGAAAKTLHGTLTILLLAMIGIHVAGVAVESWLGRENLVRAMVTGRKRLPSDAPRPRLRPARPRAAAATFAAFALAAGGTLFGLSRLPVPADPATLVLDRTYAIECGDCHAPFHPSLLPAASWAGMMARLEDHFGEDASLDPETTRMIADYLTANAAEVWDSEAANRFRLVSKAEPWRITATPYWVAKHAGIDAARFSAAPVSSKANCGACHRDAATGRFDDQKIRLPGIETAGEPKPGA